MADEEQQAADDKWGDEIGDERQAELEQRLRAWEQEVDHGERKGPFDGRGLSEEERARVRLSGADVFWLAARALAGTDEVQATAQQMANLRRVQNDVGASSQMRLVGLHLERALLFEAHLEGAFLREAHLEEASLEEAHLEGADLEEAHLEGAFLWRAHLEGADLEDAHLEGADLPESHLDGADIRGARLQSANLSLAFLNSATNLQATQVSDQAGPLMSVLRFFVRRGSAGAVSLADVHWNGADLTGVDWSALHRLGDEHGKHRWWRSRFEQERATRANIQLSKQLDNAGLKDDSDRFAYRAQVCQRGVHLRRFRLGRWLFSWLLFILAGYGYRPLRTLFWYLAVIGAFAFAYFQATHGTLTFGLPASQIQPLPWYEALVLSVSSFHGRGFFQPVQSLGDPVAILAAMEAVFGLFIEVSFIATFTQRYFGK